MNPAVAVGEGRTRGAAEAVAIRTLKITTKTDTKLEDLRDFVKVDVIQEGGLLKKWIVAVTLIEQTAPEFRLSEDNTVLLAYGGYSTDIIIPPTVKEIANEAFKGIGITKVNLANVEKIGEHAFYGCPLEEVQFGSVTTIGISAFENCGKIKYLDFANVKTIESRAFRGCSSLEYVTFREVNFIGESAFEKCTQLKELIFPKSATLRESAFYSCGALNVVKFEELYDTYKIGKHVFDRAGESFEMRDPSGKVKTQQQDQDQAAPEPVEATKPPEFALSDNGEVLIKYTGTDAKVQIPISVKKIASEAFKGTSVKEVDFSNTETIEERAFYECSALEGISFMRVNAIGVSAFEGCVNLKEVDFSYVGTIADHAFKNCSTLEKILFKEETHIGAAAFENCVRLKELDFPKAVKIQDKAFYACKDLKLANFGQSSLIGRETFERSDTTVRLTGDVFEVSQDGRELFKYKGSNTKIVIPTSVVKIAAEAFMDSLIVTVDFSNVQTIEHHAFDGCRDLRSVEFKEVTTIEKSAFEDCVQLKELSFPKRVELGEAAFYACEGLETVEFRYPSAIGDATFERCVSLKDVYSKDGFIRIGVSSFDGCVDLERIQKLDGIVEIRKSAFRKCLALKRIDLPPSVQEIDKSVFSSCNSLEIHCQYLGEWRKNWNGGRPVYMNGEPVIPGDEKITDKVIERDYRKDDQGRLVNNANKNRFIDPSRNFVIDITPAGHNLVKYIGIEEKVVIPPEVTVIGEEAFINNRVVTHVSLANVARIGNYAFDNCSNLKSVSFDNVIHVGDSAFEDCALKSVEFFKDVHIGDSAFYSCRDLTSVVFHENVLLLEYAAFGRCNSLREVTIKKNCPTIWECAFEKCTDLWRIEKLDSVTAIGDAAFRRCQRMPKIELPVRLKNSGMGEAVFSGCNDLTIVWLGE